MRSLASMMPQRWSSEQIRLTHDLILVFLVGLGVRIIWVALIPPWATPDEPSHFTYVTHLAEQGEIPSQTEGNEAYPEMADEVTKSWGYLAIDQVSGLGAKFGGSRAYLAVQHDYDTARRFKAPHSERMTRRGAAASGYPPVYYAYSAIFYSVFDSAPLLARLYATRASSALLGALTCCFSYLLAWELGRSRAWAQATALAMALMPMHAFITASVNNDAAMFLVSTALCWLILVCLRRPKVTFRLAAGLGVLCGLILVTKQTAGSLIIVAAGVLAVRAFPVSRHPWRLVRDRIFALATFVASLLIIDVPWIVYRAASAKVASARVTSEGGIVINVLDDAKYTLAAYLEHKISLGSDYYHWLFMRSFWGTFGWLEVFMPESVYSALGWLYVIAAVGLLVRLLRDRGARAGTLLLLGLVLGHVLVLFLAVDYRLFFARYGAGLGLQGRYFFVTLAPLLALIVSGWSALFRDHPFAVRLIPIASLMLALLSFSTMLSYYYGVEFL